MRARYVGEDSIQRVVEKASECRVTACRTWTAAAVSPRSPARPQRDRAARWPRPARRRAAAPRRRATTSGPSRRRRGGAPTPPRRAPAARPRWRARTGSAPPCRRAREAKLGLAPSARQARPDDELVAALRDAEHRLDRGTVHPRRRAGVPAPAAAADVGRRAVDVAGHHVGLDPVRLGAAGAARPVRRAQVGEVAVGGVAVAERRLRHHRPDAGVRILAAVLAHAGRIGLDVAGARLGVGERRIEQADEAGVAVDELAVERGHRLARERLGRRAREHRPRLRDQVDAALGVGARAERRAVVEEGAPVPLAVPARGLQRVAPAARGLLPARGALVLAALLGDRREAPDEIAQEPGEPHRFAAALVADAVHAVVPVAGAHQRQAVRADAEAAIDRARAVLEDARRLLADRGRVVGVLGALGDRRAFEERHALVEHARVAGRRDVVRAGVRQPEQVVGEMGAHAGAGGRVPPVLDVAGGELARRGQDDLLAQQRRRGPGERHRVLQLVAKAVGAAGLVEAGPRPEPAGDRLVQQPAVDHRVEERIGRAHDGRAEQLVPARAHLLQAVQRRHQRGLLGERERGRLAGAVAEQEDAVDRVAGAQREPGRERGARVEAAAARLPVVIGDDGAAARVEQLAPVAGPVGEVLAVAGEGEEGGAAAEAGRAVALRAEEHGRAPLDGLVAAFEDVVMTGGGAHPRRCWCACCCGRCAARRGSIRRCRPGAAASSGGRG